MILTEEKTYIINVTEVDTDAELGLNKKDIMIKYTNLELLHAVLASTMPYGRLSGALPRKTEGGAAVTDCDGGECARNTRRPAGKSGADYVSRHGGAQCNLSLSRHHLHAADCAEAVRN